MRGQQHRHALALERPDHVEQLQGRLRVESGGGLVQNRDRGFLHQDLGEPEALAHAAREGGDAVIRDFGELDPPQRRRHPVLALGLAHAHQPRGVAKVLGRRHVIVEADGVRQISDPPLDRERLALGIVPQHPRLAFGEVGQPEQHQDGGGFAGAVRAEEGDDLTVADGEVEAADRLNGPEMLVHPVEADRAGRAAAGVCPRCLARLKSHFCWSHRCGRNGEAADILRKMPCSVKRVTRRASA